MADTRTQMADAPTKLDASTKSDARYHRAVRWCHWLMAACFLFMWGSGYYMRNWMADDSAMQEYLYDLHKSGGVTLLVLLCLRLSARLLTYVPDLPRSIPPHERKAARIGHLGIYMLIMLGLLTGWALTDFGGHGVVFFGLPMPQVFPVREQLFGITLDPLTSTIHAWLNYTLLALALIHIAAFAKHRFRDGIDLLPRISVWPSRRARVPSG